MAKKKIRNFKESFDMAEERAGYHKQASVLLDMPYVEDVFMQDLTLGSQSTKSTKKGWNPSQSKYVGWGKTNETRPGVQERIDRDYDANVEPDDEGDWKEAMIFGGGIGVGRRSI